MSWLRLYDEVVDDPKVQNLPLLLFRAWINCLCIAKKHNGSLPEMRAVAYRLHVTESRAQVIVDQLIEAELFNKINGVIIPHNWAGRQFQSDVSTARVHRFRQQKRNVSETVNETDQRQSTETEQIRAESPIVPKPYPAEFEEFWSCYPNKTGKGDALKAWKKIKPSLGLRNQICVAIRLQKTSRQWIDENGRFIPKPATWLNQRRWDDELPPSTSQGDIRVW